MPAIYQETEEQKAERRREAKRQANARANAKRAAKRADAPASRVVRDEADDDDDSLPATPSYLAEQARKRADERAQRERQQHLESLALQEAEAVRILEAAAAGTLDLDDDAVPAPVPAPVVAPTRTAPRMRVVQSSERAAPQRAHPEEEISKAQLVCALEVLLAASRRKARAKLGAADPYAHERELGIGEGLQIALGLLSDLLAD